MLSDRKILMEIAEGKIAIEPFHEACLGSNSYDVHLGEKLACYKRKLKWWAIPFPFLWFFWWAREPLDSKKELELREFVIPERGFVLKPGRFYLGVTQEYTECDRHYVPTLDGKSSGGRLSVRIHATAGKGDAGFKGNWTLEIDVVEPVRVYAGMPLGQLSYETMEGWVDQPYSKKKSAKYQNQEARPVVSKMYKNWSEETRSWIPDETPRQTRADQLVANGAAQR